jgi:hypothetical protein
MNIWRHDWPSRSTQCNCKWHKVDGWIGVQRAMCRNQSSPSPKSGRRLIRVPHVICRKDPPLSSKTWLILNDQSINKVAGQWRFLAVQCDTRPGALVKAARRSIFEYDWIRKISKKTYRLETTQTTWRRPGFVIVSVITQPLESTWKRGSSQSLG